MNLSRARCMPMSRCLLPLGLCSLMLHFAAAQEGKRPDLTGKVLSEAGAPVANASVFIYTAGPKVGTGVLCPSCYADCRKTARTDAAGVFRIESLDPALQFRVLVAAPGHRPEFATKVDPATGPIEVKVKSASRGNTDPNCLISGRVRSVDGKPVEGAVISPNGVSAGGVTWWGSSRGMEPLAVSDSQGRFSLYSPTPFETVTLTVEARGLAKRSFNKLASGSASHDLTVTEGASVSGRVLKDGQPLAGVEVGMCGASRAAGEFVGDFTVATDRDGRFQFVNLPPKTDYYIYGRMESLKGAGGVLARRMRVGEDGTTQSAGDLRAGSAARVTGRVVLSDGKPVPPDTQVMLSRREAWDSQRVVADADGGFAFEGVPDEAVSLSVRVNGYRFSAQNASLDTLNAFSLVGRAKSDRKGLLVLLEPGGRHEGLNGATELLLRELPLRGAEEALAEPGTFAVSGKVVDKATGKPVEAFTVREGYKDRSFGQTAYLPGRTFKSADGAFTVHFHKPGQVQAQLAVEAEGFVTKVSDTLKDGDGKLVLELERGAGPGGVVLLPDGRPAASTTVHLCDLRNGVYMSEPGSVRGQMYRGTETTETDAEGRFSFKPRPDAYCVIVVSDQGYAQVPIEQLQRTRRVQIGKWSRVTGRLMIGSQPGAKETVRLGQAFIPYAHEPRSFPPLSLHYTTTTDADGRFTFDKVPPLDVSVYHSPKVRDAKMGTIPQAQERHLHARPGETMELKLGGEGRPVIGKITVKGYEGTVDWRSDVHSLTLNRAEPPGAAELKQITSDFSEKLRATTDKDELKVLREDYQRRRAEVTEEQKRFYRSDAGRAHAFSARRYALNFQPDGTFRVEDVPAGEYQLSIRLNEPTGDRPTPSMGKLIGSLQATVTVPAAPGGRSDEPVDAGAFEITARNSLKTGSLAPGFQAQTVDGQPLKLADFRGKFVLLDFWATWCGPCVAELPHLKETYEAFKNDDRFVLVSLSLDQDAKLPREFAKKNNMLWIQGFLGEWSKTEVPNQFGVQGIPSLFLVGPDGTIVAKDFRGSAIKGAVERVLNAQPRGGPQRALPLK